MSGVAIVGMSGRFPGASDLEAFWRNLRDGVESISRFTAADLAAAGIDPVALDAPGYVNAGGVLDGIERFDAPFFGYSPLEADILDPQHRIFLECAWEALEQAGYDAERYPGLIGVYGGAGQGSYLFDLRTDRELVKLVGGLQLNIANEKDHLTTRVAYKLGLRGPALTVQTACSTSLAAVCLAAQSLLGHHCDMALAGGVSIGVPQRTGYFHREGGILSPDGHCRAFDAEARGTVGGSGAGVVALKRLEDALADGDTVRAVIRGCALNNDGALKVGYTAPSVGGQAEVIAMAQAAAGVEPETVTCVEAHGTGTPLGDPIEVAALTEVFRAGTDRKGFCALGSVKTNVGHLDAAAGVAGLIKTVLALEHRQIPPSLHFRTPNPKLELAESPFYVNTALRAWEADGAPRRAGVSSFGIGGTNAHAVLEEAPPPAPAAAARPWQLLVLSAKTPAALERATAGLAAHLAAHPEVDLADAAFTLQVGRKAFAHRRMAVCGGRDANDALADPRRTLTAVHEGGERPVAFLFPGQGAQHAGMGLELYRSEPAFREQVDRCADLLHPKLDVDLRELLADGERLERTVYAQPALFAVEYALARLWMGWGVRPQAMIGHSLGEYVAACLAGVLSLEDALTLVAARGRLMQRMPAGAMLAVPLPETELLRRLGPGLALAAVNGPALCVASGPEAEIARLEAELAAAGVQGRRLHTSHAFHSSMMAPVRDELAALLAGMELHPPALDYLSNVTGGWTAPEAAASAEAWADHLLRPGRFADSLRELLREGDPILLEVGPGHTLGTFARQQTPAGALSSLPHPGDAQPEVPFLLRALGRLWLAGVPVDWEVFHGSGRRRVPLPTYPFERERHWIDPRPRAETAAARPAGARKRPAVADWLYVPSWQRTAPPPPVPAETGTGWLVFADRCGLGRALVRRLRREGHEAALVAPGKSFQRRRDGEYAVHPRQRADYDALLADLRTRGGPPSRVVHLWGVTLADGGDRFERERDLGFYSLLFLAQALAAGPRPAPVRIDVVTSHMQEVADDACLQPGKATVLGPCKVIPQELPGITCRSLDVSLGGTRAGERLVEQVWAELRGAGADPVVAWRGSHRWVQTFQPAAPGAVPPRLRPRGVYLITGGLGAIGLTLAGHLARTLGARLTLLGRSAPSERALHRLREIEAAGGEVLTVRADAADPRQLREAVERTRERFGALHGVVHAAGANEAEAFRSLLEMDAAACERHFRPKAAGVRALAEALRGENLDFCLLFSSLSAVLGGLGFVAYAAANAYMDAFATRERQTGGGPWLSADWDGWRFRDEAVAGATIAGLAIAPQEGMEAFERLLAGAAGPQVVVSTGDLDARVEQWVRLSSVRRAEPASAAAAHSRPELPSTYVAPRDELEGAVAAVWQRLLGVEKVGVHDDFIELGGHSLLAIQLISRLRDELQVELSVHQLFGAPTVADLARLVGTTREARREETAAFDRMLELVEQLSEAELEALLEGGEAVD